MKVKENITAGKTVSRSVYQKLAEENKKLKADLKAICYGEPSTETYIARRKWHQYFTKEAKFNSIMKQYAVNYLAEHPEYNIATK